MQREITPESVLHTLHKFHQGRDSGATVKSLAKEITGKTPAASDEREVRYAVTALREQGHPICAHPGRGYFLAIHSGEISETCEFLFSRAMTTLKQVAALKKKAMPELRGQLGMELNQSRD